MAEWRTRPTEERGGDWTGRTGQSGRASQRALAADGSRAANGALGQKTGETSMTSS